MVVRRWHEVIRLKILGGCCSGEGRESDDGQAFARKNEVSHMNAPNTKQHICCLNNRFYHVFSEAEPYWHSNLAFFPVLSGSEAAALNFTSFAFSNSTTSGANRDNISGYLRQSMEGVTWTRALRTELRRFARHDTSRDGSRFE